MYHSAQDKNRLGMDRVTEKRPILIGCIGGQLHYLTRPVRSKPGFPGDVPGQSEVDHVHGRVRSSYIVGEPFLVRYADKNNCQGYCDNGGGSRRNHETNPARPENHRRGFGQRSLFNPDWKIRRGFDTRQLVELFDTLAVGGYTASAFLTTIQVGLTLGERLSSQLPVKIGGEMPQKIPAIHLEKSLQSCFVE